MSVLDIPRGLRHTRPFSTVEALVVQPIFDRFIGVHLDAQGIRTREQMGPLVKVKLGAEAVEAAAKKHEYDPELDGIGRALAATGVLEAEDPDRDMVPPDVLKEVHDVGAAVLGGVEKIPNIPREKADRVAAILRDTNILG